MKNKDIGRQLAQINHAIKREIESQEHSELMKISMSNGYILMYLHDHREEDVFQKDIEQAFNVTRSTTSKVLALMETKGLIQRHSVPGDARLKKILLTKSGEEMRNGILCGRQKLEQKMIKDFSPEEIEQLYNYLQRLKNNIKGECDK